jgi:anaerobic glycerol-3-phosphate dehydrogenase
MSDTIKEAFVGVLHAIAEKQFNEIQMLPDSMLAVRKGKQTLKQGFPVGSTVTANGNGTVRAGCVAKVISRYKENGYWYYVTDKMGVQRQQDLTTTN